MRAERRQELRTNELSQQLDQLTDYVRKNLAKVAALLLVAAFVVGGGYWYINHERSKIMDGWTALSADAALAAEGPAIDRYEQIASQGLSPALTVEALLKVGDTALDEIRNLDPSSTAGKSNLDKDALRAKALDAYEQVVSRFPTDLTAAGKAMILLGVLAEESHDMEKARTRYRNLLEMSAYDGTPFEMQAQYRLENMDKWANPAAFPPMLVGAPEPSPLDAQAPPLTAPAPPTTAPAPTTQSAALGTASASPTAPTATPTTPTAAPITPVAAPVPTTQPAAAP